MDGPGAIVAPHAATEQLNGRGKLPVVLPRSISSRRHGSLILAQIAEMVEAGQGRNASCGRPGVRCRLVRPRESTAAANSLGERSVRRIPRANAIQLRRRRGIGRAPVLLLRISRCHRRRRTLLAAKVQRRVRGRVAGAWVVVHGHQNRSGLEELHLLVLGNQKLGRVGPFGSMLPQMLGQATAMLIPLPALLAAKFGAVALPAFFDEWLAVAGSSHPGLLIPLIPRHIIDLVIDGALLDIDRPVRRRKLVSGEARWRGWQAAREASPGEGVPRRCVPPTTNGNGQWHGFVTGFLEGRGNGSQIGARVCHALATSDAVCSVEGSADDGVGRGARMRLSIGSKAARYGIGGHGRSM